MDTDTGWKPLIAQFFGGGTSDAAFAALRSAVLMHPSVA
jgi:hypothetical protein